MLTCSHWESFIFLQRRQTIVCYTSDVSWSKPFMLRCSIWFDFFCLVMLYTNLLDMSLYSLIQVLLSFLRFVKLVSVFWNCTCTKFILVLQLKHASRYNYWPIKDQSTISMLPENAKNPEVVWRFRGVWKGIIVLKCVKCFC